MTDSDRPGQEWTLSLRQQPAGDAGRGPGADGPGEYELICRDCGDDPRRGYHQVTAEFQHVRGPYQLKAGVEAFLEHG